MDQTLKKNSSKLLGEIEKALEDVLYGSVQIFITDGEVSQITKTVIKKTSLKLNNNEKSNTFQNNSESVIQSKTKINLTLDK